MPRKSYMFTTRKHSKNGIIAVILGITSLTGLVAAILISFANRGTTPLRLGGAGLVGMIAGTFGFVVGLMSTKEYDSYMLFPRMGVILNGLAVFAWAYIIIIGIYGINI